MVEYRYPTNGIGVRTTPGGSRLTGCGVSDVLFYAAEMQRQQILVAFGVEGAGEALGNVWRLTAKNTDFYLDPVGDAGAFHLSMHGPSDSNPDGYRFHVKVDQRAAASISAQGGFIVHQLPRKGYAVDGVAIAPGAFLVARIRWLWDLQRPRFRQAAASGALPEIPADASAARLTKELEPNDGADLDLVVSYGGPHWPAETSERDNSRLGPLQNSAGMWLTATSYRRSQSKYPAPKGLVPPLPRAGQEPNRILGGGQGDNAPADIFWFVEAITTRTIIEATQRQDRDEQNA
jgi:hypothetical protein